jgi:hypothetical protein
MLVNMKRKSTKKVGAPKNPELNTTYTKIGKRIRQARLAAKFTNSRGLCVEVFSWSAGRINNFETGISTPGPDETVALAENSESIHVGSPTVLNQCAQPIITRHVTATS